MKHIVLIVGSYYPNYSAVGKCMGNIAKELAKDNKITVICEKTSLEQSDLDKLDSQNIIRVTTKRRKRYLGSSEKPLDNSGMIQLIKNKYYKVERFLFRTLSKSAVDNAMVAAYGEALRGINDNIDVIIPSCSPFESVIAACNYKKENKMVEIIPYLFDLFAANKNLNYFEFIKKIKWKNNIILEKEAFQYSKKVLHVENWSEHISNSLADYCDKCILVEHPLLTPRESRTGDNSKNNNYIDNTEKDRGKNTIVFAGSLIKGYVDANEVIELFSDDAFNDFDVYFYSSGSGTDVVMNCKKKNIHLKGWVSREELEKVYDKADAFISIAEKNGNQMSSKIFDYMSFGKPIIHFYFKDHDVNIKYLNKYKGSLLIKIDKNIVNETGLIKSFIKANSNADNACYDDTLIECTPEYISGVIRESI